MSETTPPIKAALNLRVGAGFDVYIAFQGESFWQNLKQLVFRNLHRTIRKRQILRLG